MNQKTKGMVCILLSAFCFAWMNAFVHLSGDLPFMQKAFFRNSVAAVFAAAILLRNKQPFRPAQTGNFKYLLLRAVFGTVGILCNFYAVDHLVLADASMLNKMSPFFAVLFSYFLLKERLTPVQLGAVAAAFGGAMLIVKPTFENAQLLPSLLGFLGGMDAGAAYAMVRKLGTRGENGSYIVFFFSVFSCLVTLPFLLLDYHPMTMRQLLCLIGAGTAGCGGQFGITMAYCYAPAREISVYDYAQIPFAALLGWALFGQLPDGWSALGYLVILTVAVGMYCYNNEKFPFRPKEKPEE